VNGDNTKNISTVESCALFACQIIKYLFTSASKPLHFRQTSYAQRLLLANCRFVNFTTFLLILKGLFLLSKPRGPLTPHFPGHLFHVRLFLHQGPYNTDNSKIDQRKDKAKLKQSEAKYSGQEENQVLVFFFLIFLFSTNTKQIAFQVM
jgi:hypothetical protein